MSSHDSQQGYPTRACDITGLSPIAFDHKQIIRYFYFTLKTCLITTCLQYIIDVDYILVTGVNNTSNFSQGNICTLNVSQGYNCTFNVSQCNNCQLSHTSNILVVITLL